VQYERLSHGVKEGLVSHPTEWPGATGVHTLLDNAPVPGIWVNRTALYQARRMGEDVTGAPAAEADFTEHTTFQLSPLPAWSHLPFVERRHRVQTLIEEAVAEAEDKNRKLGRTPPGREALMLVDPHSSPADSKTSPAPRAHFRDVNYWIDFLERMLHFTIEYREASFRYLRGASDVRFPRDCFPPPLTFASPRNQALFPT